MSVFLERKSIRNYDTNYKLPKELLEKILTEAYRAPSSMNLQSSRFVVIQSDEARQKLGTVLYGNQTQLNTSSAMILICSDANKFDYAEKIFNTAVEKKLMPESVRDAQLTNFNNLKPRFTRDVLDRDGYIDGGLLAMQLMLIAKSYGLDTCAIGGFDRTRIIERLGLKENYTPVIIISLGKANENGFDSVRLELKDTTTYL